MSRSVVDAGEAARWSCRSRRPDRCTASRGAGATRWPAPSPTLPVLRGVVAEAADAAGLVVVAEVEAVPADVAEAPPASVPTTCFRWSTSPGRGPTCRAGPSRGRRVELEDHVELAARRVGVEPPLLHGGPGVSPTLSSPGGRWAKTSRCISCRNSCTHGPWRTRGDPGHRTRRVSIGGRPERLRTADDTPSRRSERVVVDGDLRDQVDDVHPEAVDATVEPPVHHRVDRLPHLPVLPVQLRLAGREDVQVVLVRVGVS